MAGRDNPAGTVPGGVIIRLNAGLGGREADPDPGGALIVIQVEF